jgi:cbb3-type cytochrome oxidase subunit 3
MSLTEIMSNAGLSRYAEWALLLFVFAFVLVLVRVLRPSQRAELEAHGRLPLEDEATPRHHR